MQHSRSGYSDEVHTLPPSGIGDGSGVGSRVGLELGTADGSGVGVGVGGGVGQHFMPITPHRFWRPGQSMAEAEPRRGRKTIAKRMMAMSRRIGRSESDEDLVL